MKLLVLALCVCAASAATYARGSSGAYNPWQKAVSVVQPVVQPVAQAVKAVAKAVVYTGVDAEATILRSDSEVNADSFNYAYETGNGISAQSSGALKRVNDVDVLTVQGGFRYLGSDGTPFELSYIADENGYQPKSDLLPVSPPVPEAIRRALEYVLAHPPKEEVKKFY